MIDHILYTFLILFIIIFYSYLIFKKTTYPAVNLYLIINIIFFYLPALLYLLFGITHPALSYDNNYTFEYDTVFLKGIFLILSFDIIVLASYFTFNVNLYTNPTYLNNSLNIEKIKNFKLYFIIIFFSVILFDIFNIILNNPFMSRDYLECNHNLAKLFELHKSINSIYFFKGFKQIIAEFSNLKFFLLIISLYQYLLEKTNTIRTHFLIILSYNIILGFFIESKFNIFIIFIILFCVNYNNIIKIKGFFIALVIFYCSLYIFPLMAYGRTFYSRNIGVLNPLINQSEPHNKDCVIIGDKFKEIYQIVSSNNIHLIEKKGLFNHFGYNIGEYLTNQSILSKPFEVILSRLNYFDITLRSVNLKINNFVENNYSFYFDNIYALIPRIFFPDKEIISTNSHYLSIDLGVSNIPILHAVGLRPIAESFYYLGYFFIIVPICLGFIFFLLKKIYLSSNILLKTTSLYMSILIIKRDSFHTLLPGLTFEFLIFIYLISINYFLNKYKEKF